MNKPLKINLKSKIPSGLKIINVLPQSIAHKKKIVTNDKIISINNFFISDLLDYHFHISDEKLSVILKSVEGEVRKVRIKREPDEDIGIIPEEMKPRRCYNNCIFCFIHQMPKGLRKSLYLKDEDYRLSFLHGNFITATDLSEVDLKRIVELRLSPIYISVHTTNPSLRAFMLGRKGIPNILDIIKYLTENSINIHTQIVLCPEINDKLELERTVNDLSQFYPRLQSIAVVPVGLTKYRRNLYPLKNITAPYARKVIAQLQSIQNKCQKKYGENFIFLADEFYLIADMPFPSFKHYGDFPQFENGVGMVVSFLRDWGKIKKKLLGEINRKKRVGIVTSTLSYKFLKPILGCPNRIGNLTVNMLPVKNEFFGETVTVTGLLSGKDILKAIKSGSEYDHYIIPGNSLKSEEPSCYPLKKETGELTYPLRGKSFDEYVFLDDLSLGELKEEIKKPVSLVYYSIKELIDEVLLPVG